MPMKALVPVKIDTFMATNRKTTFALVSQYQLPAIFGFRFYTSEGGLMPYVAYGLFGLAVGLLIGLSIVITTKHYLEGVESVFAERGANSTEVPSGSTR
jgi:hypothetical protein